MKLINFSLSRITLTKNQQALLKWFIYVYIYFYFLLNFELSNVIDILYCHMHVSRGLENFI